MLVIMATRNGADCIGQQIDSIVNQRNVQIRLFVRDDCSTDDTAELVQTHAQGVLQVLERAPSPSGSAAANFLAAIESADRTDCEYVALSDQDDLWDPDKLGRAVEALRESGAAGYSAAVRATWPDGRAHDLVQSARIRAGDYLQEGAGQGCTFVLTGELYDYVRATIRGHAEALRGLHYHDWLIYALARSRGMRWHFDHVSCMAYRQHEANDTGAKTGLAGLQKRIRQVRSGWYRRQLLQIARIVVRARPDDHVADYWLNLLERRDRLRRLRSALFTLKHGRRAISDRLALTAFCLAGWI